LKLEYNKQSESTMKVAKQWEISLLKWTNICGQYCHEFKACALLVVHLTISNKHKVAVIYELKGHPHKICCVDGCNGNAQNLELKRVSDMPAE
jgi:hypothetical protein